MEHINKESEFYQQIAEKSPTVAVFKAAWCKDCHFLDLFMPEILQKYEAKFKFIEVDRDNFMDLFEKYNVLGIPSFIVFTENKEIMRFVSKLRKTKEEIELFLDRAIEVNHTMTK